MRMKHGEASVQVSCSLIVRQVSWAIKRIGLSQDVVLGECGSRRAGLFEDAAGAYVYSQLGNPSLS